MDGRTLSELAAATAAAATFIYGFKNKRMMKPAPVSAVEQNDPQVLQDQLLRETIDRLEARHPEELANARSAALLEGENKGRKEERELVEQKHGHELSKLEARHLEELASARNAALLEGENKGRKEERELVEQKHWHEMLRRESWHREELLRAEDKGRSDGINFGKTSFFSELRTRYIPKWSVETKWPLKKDQTVTLVISLMWGEIEISSRSEVIVKLTRQIVDANELTAYLQGFLKIAAPVGLAIGLPPAA